ncbi:hypothetical protein CR513_62928, partial [Mucuna pruriens]
MYPPNADKTTFMTNGLIYCHQAQSALQKFEKSKVRHVPRDDNSHANTLARLSTSKTPPRHIVLHKVLVSPTVDRPEVLQAEARDKGWMTPIWNYLHNGTTSKDKVEVAKIYGTTSQYVIEVNHLYKRGLSTPLLKCLTKMQTEYVLNKIHKRIYEFHSGGCTMVARVLKTGYYWLTMREDCWMYIRNCQEALQHVATPWPFLTWGMDILRSFPKAKGQVKFLLIGMDYVTKWVEAKPLTQVTTQKVQKFV